VNSINEKGSRLGAAARVVLDANQSGLPSISDENPDRFGATEDDRRRPDRRSLPSLDDAVSAPRSAASVRGQTYPPPPRGDADEDEPPAGLARPAGGV
jgi:hypothetical protein